MRRQRRSSPPDKQQTAPRVRNLPERVQIRDALSAMDAPATVDNLCDFFALKGQRANDALFRRVRAMVRDGELLELRRGRYGLPDKLDVIPGRVIAHPDGYAFVAVDAGGDDIYLAPREARQALHDDRVLVRVSGTDRRGRPYGHIVEVIERAHQEIVGRFAAEQGIGFVSPDNRRINQDVLIPPGANGAAVDGDIVVARIEQQPDRRSQPIGRVVEVLGRELAAGMETAVAIRSHGLPVDWPAAVERQVARVPGAVRKRDIQSREDLRELPLVTIDGADARDFDDAVHARRTRNGFVLTVAIADVAHYVQAGSALDEEALNRGTSVYFPDRVVPMLPESLSNGLCSLMPEVERLALVCEMVVTPGGEVRRSRFYKAVICSAARLIYDDVQAYRDGAEEALGAAPAAVRKNIDALYDLYACLRAAREARGALEIDSPQPVFRFGDGGKIDAVEVTRRNDAHRLIEECMIAANVAAARFILRRHAAGVFRNHDRPDEEKCTALTEFLRSLGLTVPALEEAQPAAFAQVLAAAQGRPDQRVIETVVMRSMKLAVYSAENIGHFGLGLDAYTHFTSPIRRYPDLVVHRVIEQLLSSSEGVDPALLPEVAEHASMCERRADEATRDATLALKCEFMLDKVGQQFDGVIAGVAEFGLFVELDGIFVEGLLHVSELPGDYYQFDAARHTLRGRGKHRRYALAEPISVIVARVSMDERKIDFSLASAAGGSRSGRGRRGRRAR